jgi:hypothetical protein
VWQIVQKYTNDRNKSPDVEELNLTLKSIKSKKSDLGASATSLPPLG